MNGKISDFKLAEYVLRKICKQVGTHFVDLPVSFGDTNLSASLVVTQSNDKLGKTIFEIIAGYVKNISSIDGSAHSFSNEDFATVVNVAAATVRDYTTGQMFPQALARLPATMSLNRDPFVWIVLRDVICPAYNIPLKNIKVIAGTSAHIDAAKLIDKETITASMTLGADQFKLNDEQDQFIFVNMQVENYACRVAAILCEAIKAHGLSAQVTIREMLTKTELSDKFMGVAGMAIGDSAQMNDFIMALGMFIDFEESFMFIEAASKKRIKKAQMGGGQSPTSSHSSFWQLGLTEKMLEPMRGSDWTPYYIYKPFTDELWQKIDAEKRRRGLAELPIELLLRVQSEEYHNDPDLTIQGLLADNRVW